jgi:hypothetical protein
MGLDDWIAGSQILRLLCEGVAIGGLQISILGAEETTRLGSLFPQPSQLSISDPDLRDIMPPRSRLLSTNSNAFYATN